MVILKHQIDFLQSTSIWLSYKHRLYKLLFAKFDFVDAVSNHMTSSLPILPLNIWKTQKSFQNWWLHELNNQKIEGMHSSISLEFWAQLFKVNDIVS